MRTSKYTISKAFSKAFQFPIWKIEVDECSKIIALECRDPKSTVAYISVISFEGHILLENFELPDKQWSLSAIQAHQIILKKLGDSSPIHPGVWIFDYREPNNSYLYPQYQYLATLQDYVQIRPQHISAGYEQYYCLQTNTISSKKPTTIKLFENDIVLPLSFNATKPAFLDRFTNQEDLWISKAGDQYIWSFHEKHDNHYAVRLVLSDHEKIWDQQLIIENLNLKLVQIYFQIGRQIFLLTHNKHEFVSYLV